MVAPTSQFSAGVRCLRASLGYKLSSITWAKSICAPSLAQAAAEPSLAMAIDEPAEPEGVTREWVAWSAMAPCNESLPTP